MDEIGIYKSRYKTLEMRMKSSSFTSIAIINDSNRSPSLEGMANVLQTHFKLPAMYYVPPCTVGDTPMWSTPIFLRRNIKKLSFVSHAKHRMTAWANVSPVQELFQQTWHLHNQRVNNIIHFDWSELEHGLHYQFRITDNFKLLAGEWRFQRRLYSHLHHAIPTIRPQRMLASTWTDV